jgi:hypothetical protein
MQAFFEKLPGGYLAPVGEEAELFVAGLKQGAGVKLDVTKVRNIRFHKKVLKLIRTGFEYWSPDASPDAVRIDGIVAAKDFETFRKNVLILAGHCDTVFKLDGSFTFKARSIAFPNCSELEFQRVYKCILDVIWERIMKDHHYRTPAELDAVINQLLSFT